MHSSIIELIMGGSTIADSLTSFLFCGICVGGIVSAGYLVSLGRKKCTKR